MERSHINLTEGGVFLMIVRHHLILPLLPVTLRRITEIIKSITRFGEFDFSDRSPEGIEFLLIFFIILAASDGTAKRPHASKDKQGLVSGFLGFFFQVIQGLIMFN